jgi:hypothetical protein
LSDLDLIVTTFRVNDYRNYRLVNTRTGTAFKYVLSELPGVHGMWQVDNFVIVSVAPNRPPQ